MQKFKIEVKHKDLKGWFNITNIELQKDFTIRTEFSLYESLKFDTLEEAERSLALVRQDLKKSKGYTTQIVKR